MTGAQPRPRMTYDFERAPVPRPSGVNLGYVRASALAQVRLQLAVLSGNRRGALRELDRLVEIDREMEAFAAQGPQSPLPGAVLIAQLDEQRQAIATEKLALMAATEFPRIAPSERSIVIENAAEDEVVVIEDSEFGPRLARIMGWLLAFLALGTALAFASPLLASL